MKSPAGEQRTTVNVSLGEGDWLDVMDSEGTWNVARIVRFVNPKDVEVTYDGWGHEYDEIVTINSERVAPYHTYTWSVKCWAKYKNWPWWPSIATIRSPGTIAGQAYLEGENRLFIDFLDRKDFTKRCRCWVELSKITPFEDKYDERRKRTTGTDFEASLAMSLKSTAITKFPVFTKGTLPEEYKSRIADPVKTMRKRIGMNKWAGSFSSSLGRHSAVYSYKPADGVAFLEDDEDEEEDDFLVQFAAVSDQEDDKPKKHHTKGKAKAPARRKVGRTSTGGKGPTSRRVQEVSAPVVQREDSAGVLDVPHAESLVKGSDEQPLFLSPIDEQVDGGLLSELNGSNGLPKSHAPVVKGPAIEGSRKRKSPESSESSPVAAEGGPKQPVGPREASAVGDLEKTTT